MECKNCGSENRDNAPYCINCGALLTQSIKTENQFPQKTCINCTRLINANLMTCPFCGASQMTTIGPSVFQYTPKHNKVTAGILAIFLGSFGVHKFYLGKIGLGVIYLLFCWTFIPSVIGLIEGIVYLTMSDQAFFQKYG